MKSELVVCREVEGGPMHCFGVTHDLIIFMVDLQKSAFKLEQALWVCTGWGGAFANQS